VPNQPQRFVLLGRDGVINRRVLGSYVTSWEQFEFLPRALEALRFLSENGYAVLVISNQACVGKKLLSTAQLESITRRFLTEVALAGGNIKQVYYCVHVKKDHCNCRKAKPGSIHRAQLDYAFVPQTTYFVGDSVEDLCAAGSAGCPVVLVQRDAFLESRSPGAPQTMVASSLYEAATMIVARQGHGARRPENSVAANDSARYFYATPR
jgi:D-glycero-D-manno-heptose 1,7-bisphosphate phosphatase